MAHGITTADMLKDKLFQRQLVAEIIVEANKTGNLSHPAITKSISFEGLHARIPLMEAVKVEEDLGEFEETGVQTAGFSAVDFDLYKDRFKVSISDESQMAANIAAPFEMQRAAGIDKLAAAMDRKIATALATTPQTTSWDISEENIAITAIPTAIGDISPHPITGIGMNGATYAKVVGLSAANGLKSGFNNFNADGTLNGTILGLPQATVILSENLADNKIYAVSNKVPGVISGLHQQPKVRLYDDPKSGATILQYDVWRGVKSNIKQTSDNKNKGVVEISMV